MTLQGHLACSPTPFIYLIHSCIYSDLESLPEICCGSEFLVCAACRLFAFLSHGSNPTGAANNQQLSWHASPDVITDSPEEPGNKGSPPCTRPPRSSPPHRSCPFHSVTGDESPGFGVQRGEGTAQPLLPIWGMQQEKP